MVAVASASPLPGTVPPSTCCSPLAFPPSPCTPRRIFRTEAMKTQREKKQTEVAVEESFPFRETAPPDEPLVTAEESWVVKLEQSVNIFLTESIITILDGLYRDRNYARFFVLETIARVPYFGEDLVLHACCSLQVSKFRNIQVWFLHSTVSLTA
uniref:Uncharacterized protein n=1 Tax=Oryza meridionalis TaxID=40149 RepID=A0A0E0EJT9_9ORYZ